ncbi:MAG: class I SAM-dependent methyltransferase [Candidatus Paceibacterota bacterium]
MTDKITDSYYASRYTYNKDREVVWKEIIRFLNSFLKNKETVLDLGAGYCDFINNISAKNKIAVDISEELSKYAKSGVRQIQTNVTDLSKVENSFVDVVFASNLLEHLSDEDLEKTMNEIKRVLKSGGLFISMQPNYRLSYKTYFDDPTHKKVFSDSALESFLVSFNFKIIKKMARFLPFSLKSRPSIIPVSPLLIRAYLNSPIKPFAGQMLFVSRLDK